jgi:hypothetical protein
VGALGRGGARMVMSFRSRRSWRVIGTSPVGVIRVKVSRIEGEVRVEVGRRLDVIADCLHDFEWSADECRSIPVDGGPPRCDGV